MRADPSYQSIQGKPSQSCNVRNSLLLWVARLDDGAELKMTDPKEQQRDVEEKEAKGEERWDGVDGGRRGTSC